MALADWARSEPFEVIALPDAGAWTQLQVRFSPGHGYNELPWQRCVDVVRSGGAQTAVVEFGYIDRDYRSEYSVFFSRAFQSYPDSAVRLHFFGRSLTDEEVWDLPDDPRYLGYVILRPSPMGRVGRTFIAPPPDLAGAIQCAVVDRVSFFGQALEISGFPFAQQDQQLGRCAHVAAWLCHYTAYLRGDVARKAMAEFHSLADASLSLGRPLPSGGLTAHQLSELFRTLDLPPVFYSVDRLPDSELDWQLSDPRPERPVPIQHGGTWDTRIIPTCCRYLNSGHPVLIGTENHAFVLCGYSRRAGANGKTEIVFIAQDDQRGPYLEIPDPLSDTLRGIWMSVIAPLPEKLWLTPEAAEMTGGELLRSLCESAVVAGIPEPQSLLDLIPARKLTLHTYAVRSSSFRSGLDGRGVLSDLIREYRLARFPRYVWVVEAVDRNRRAPGAECVIGEAIFDGTSSEYGPIPLAVHVPGALIIRDADGVYRDEQMRDAGAYKSGAIGHL